MSEYFLLEESSPEKYEYLNGEVVSMAGATREHNQIVANLIREIGAFLKGGECDIFPSDFRVTTPAAENYFYPDATIVCGDAEMKPDVFDTLINPVVIIEVMSEGTRNRDRGYKFFYYQQIPTLQQYILIDSEQYAVDIISRKAGGTWKFEKHNPASKTFFIESIGMNLSFDDVYYRVLLPL